jgi:ABC-type proline/glycine betaine transport system permease subunit
MLFVVELAGNSCTQLTHFLGSFFPKTQKEVTQSIKQYSNAVFSAVVLTAVTAVPLGIYCGRIHEQDG